MSYAIVYRGTAIPASCGRPAQASSVASPAAPTHCRNRQGRAAQDVAERSDQERFAGYLWAEVLQAGQGPVSKENEGERRAEILEQTQGRLLNAFVPPA